VIARVVLIVVGVLVMAAGTVLVFWSVPLAALPNLGIWLTASVVLHDGVIGLTVAVVGWLLGRAVPDRGAPYVQGGFIVAAVVALTAIPVLLAAGRTPTNPSLLPLDYPRNLLIVIAVIAGVTVLLGLFGRSRSRRGR
jgi:hypothetical protein